MWIGISGVGGQLYAIKIAEGKTSSSRVCCDKSCHFNDKIAVLSQQYQSFIFVWTCSPAAGEQQAVLRWELFTPPQGLQVLPQNLSCSAVGHQAQEGLSVQPTQLAALQTPQLWAVEAELSLAPVQPVAHLPFWPQAWI